MIRRNLVNLNKSNHGIFCVKTENLAKKNCAYLSPGRGIQRVKDSSKRNFPRTLRASLRKPDTSYEQGTWLITARSRKGVADPLLTPAMPSIQCSSKEAPDTLRNHMSHKVLLRQAVRCHMSRILYRNKAQTRHYSCDK